MNSFGVWQRAAASVTVGSFTDRAGSASRCEMEGRFVCNPTSVVKSSVGEQVDVERR